MLWHLVLPIGCMTYGSLAALSRYMRAGMLDVLHADFVRTARAKGLSERVVIGKHALRNGLLPILTLLAGLLPAVLGGVQTRDALEKLAQRLRGSFEQARRAGTAG